MTERAVSAARFVFLLYIIAASRAASRFLIPGFVPQYGRAACCARLSGGDAALLQYKRFKAFSPVEMEGKSALFKGLIGVLRRQTKQYM